MPAGVGLNDHIESRHAPRPELVFTSGEIGETGSEDRREVDGKGDGRRIVRASEEERLREPGSEGRRPEERVCVECCSDTIDVRLVDPLDSSMTVERARMKPPSIETSSVSLSTFNGT